MDPDQQVPDVERITHDAVWVRRLVGRLGDAADQRGVAVASVQPQLFGDAASADALASSKPGLRPCFPCWIAWMRSSSLGPAPGLPVTLVFGAADSYLNPDRAGHLTGRFRHAGLRLVEGACCWLQWDQPETVAPLLKQAAPGRPLPLLTPVMVRFPELVWNNPSGTAERGTIVSHHFDSAAARADGRINPCDLYAFPAAPGTTALILTVNPDAARSSPTTFRPDARYEFVVASNGGTEEDIALRVSFTRPDDHGQQQVRVARADGPAARNGTAGTPLGQGHTGGVFSLSDDGLAWAGLAADPFSADGVALSRFFQGLAEGRYTPEVFTDAPSNLFAGRDVTAIALQVPDAALGGTRVALWARIRLDGDGGHRQVSRIGQAMLRPLFFNPFLNDPDTEAELEALNAAAPGADRAAHGERVRRIAATVARLAGLPDPAGHAERVAAAFLPDVLAYWPGQPAVFDPGGGNGRALGDDAFDIAVAVLAGSTLGSASASRLATPAFPYLSAPQPATLPAIADLARSS